MYAGTVRYRQYFGSVSTVGLGCSSFQTKIAHMEDDSRQLQLARMDHELDTLGALHNRTASGWTIADPLPNALGHGELMKALNMRSRSQFALFQRADKFKRFEFARPIA